VIQRLITAALDAKADLFDAMGIDAADLTIKVRTLRLWPEWDYHMECEVHFMTHGMKIYPVQQDGTIDKYGLHIRMSLMYDERIMRVVRDGGNLDCCTLREDSDLWETATGALQAWINHDYHLRGPSGQPETADIEEMCTDIFDSREGEQG